MLNSVFVLAYAKSKNFLMTMVHLLFIFLQERRLEKKMNKKAFTAEKIRQDKQEINLNTNLKGMKIV